MLFESAWDRYRVMNTAGGTERAGKVDTLTQAQMAAQQTNLRVAQLHSSASTGGEIWLSDHYAVQSSFQSFKCFLLIIEEVKHGS